MSFLRPTTRRPSLAWATGGVYSPTPAYTSWVGSAATITRNAVKSPDNKLNGLLVVEDGTTASHSAARANQSLTETAGQVYVHTCYAKRMAGSRNLQVTNFDSTGSFTVSVVVDLGTGAILTAPATDGLWTSLSVTTRYIGNGWWKVQLTFTGVTDTGLWFVERLVSGVSTSYAGDSVSSIAIWGTDFR